MEKHDQSNTGPANHYPTVAAIGALVYVLASITHEGIGHGGISWLVGVHSIVRLPQLMKQQIRVTDF